MFFESNSKHYSIEKKQLIAGVVRIPDVDLSICCLTQTISQAKTTLYFLFTFEMKKTSECDNFVREVSKEQEVLQSESNALTWSAAGP